MEDLGLRFSLISKIILNNLDDISLANFRKASRENSNFLENERFYWIRIIKKYNCLIGEHQEVWNKVVSKTPVETIKEFAVAVYQFHMRCTCGLKTGRCYGRACGRMICRNSQFDQFLQEKPRKCKKPTGLTALLTPVDFVQKLEKQWHPLFIGAACGTVNLCNHIIQKTDVNEPWLKNGRTPLHLAAMNGNLEVFRSFMSFMAYNFVDSEKQKTVLYAAVFGGNLDLCKLLIEEYKADVNLSDINGITPLHIASYFGHLEVCKLLCKHVTDKNPLDNTGKTPLDLAFSERKWKITRFQKVSMEKIGNTFRFVHVGLKP